MEAKLLKAIKADSNIYLTPTKITFRYDLIQRKLESTEQMDLGSCVIVTDWVFTTTEDPLQNRSKSKVDKKVEK